MCREGGRGSCRMRTNRLPAQIHKPRRRSRRAKKTVRARDRANSVLFLFLRGSIQLAKLLSGQINLFPAMNRLNRNRCYRPSRRQLLTGAAAASALALTPAVRATDPRGAGELPEAFAGLSPVGRRVRPMTADEVPGRLHTAT